MRSQIVRSRTSILTRCLALNAFAALACGAALPAQEADTLIQPVARR